MRQRIQELETKLQESHSPRESTESASAENNLASPASAANVSTKMVDTGAKNPTKAEPFAFADWTWLNGNPRTKSAAFDSTFFTPEIRADVDYIYDFNHPKDDTIGGSSEVFRSSEVQVTQLGVGGDFHYDNVRGRVMTQFGMYSHTTPRNDASPSRGQWNLDDAYRYISEAYGGYHFDMMNGINVDAGIFMSYVGLLSYYNFDNWAYQPSYVSSNTPWFFNGVRVQIFPEREAKDRAVVHQRLAVVRQVQRPPGPGRPDPVAPDRWISIIWQQLSGRRHAGQPGSHALHTDNSIQVKYYDNRSAFVSKAAFSLTGRRRLRDRRRRQLHGGNSATRAKQSFLGFMAYNRFWFDKDQVCGHRGRRKDQQPGTLPGADPADQRRHRVLGNAVFHRQPGRPVQSLGRVRNIRLHAEPIHHVSLGVQPSRSQRALLLWSRRRHASGRQHWNTRITGRWAGLLDLRKTEDRLNMAILVKF